LRFLIALDLEIRAQVQLHELGFAQPRRFRHG
jgi:hypothetical protein